MPDSGIVAGVLGLVATLVVFGGVMVAGAVEAGAGRMDAGPGSARPSASPPPSSRLPPLPRDPPGAPAALPQGKGMWLHYLRQAAGGDPAALVAKAKETGLTHVYLRLGSSKDGFYGQADLDRLLPVAHAAGLPSSGGTSPTCSTPRPTPSGPRPRSPTPRPTATASTPSRPTSRPATRA